MFAIFSSGVVWEEQKKRKRFKALKGKQSNILEAAWQQWQAEVLSGQTTSGHRMLEQKIEIDFGQPGLAGAQMMMIKPRKCVIQRRFENGVMAQYRTSQHQTQIHLKVFKLQVCVLTPNSWPAKSSNLNFHPLEVVSRYRDPQLQVGENYWYLFNPYTANHDYCLF